MNVYVVLKEDRGCGVSVAGVFASWYLADAYLASPEGSNCYLNSISGEEVRDENFTAHMNPVEELEKEIDELEMERADFNWGSDEYNAINAEIELLYLELDKAKGGVY